MEKGRTMESCAFDKLFTKHVPHIMEKIFFSLDYESYKNCLEASNTWKEVLTSQSFLKKGVNLFNKEVMEDEMELVPASGYGTAVEVKRLLSSGLVNVNYRSNYRIIDTKSLWETLYGTLGLTPLCMAAKMENYDVVKLLLDRGADCKLEDHTGWTALHWSASNGNKGVSQLLLNSGADIKKKGECGDTPLHLATRHRHIDVTKLLLDRGVEPNMVGKYGLEPVHIAATTGHIEVIQLLVQFGAKIGAKIESQYPYPVGSTPLHFAALHGHTEVVKYLLKKGAVSDAVDERKRTPLYFAATCPKVAQLLMDAGADPNRATECGNTPLHMAEMFGQKKVAKLLQNAGADPNVKNEHGKTPRQMAEDMRKKKTTYPDVIECGFCGSII